MSFSKLKHFTDDALRRFSFKSSDDDSDGGEDGWWVVLRGDNRGGW